MSDIRFNSWYHQSGTGGVHQDGSGNIGIGNTNPSSLLDVAGTIKATTYENVITAGVITASSFVGDGSGLQNIVGVGTGVYVLNNGSQVGAATTIDFTTNVDVSAIAAGILTVSVADSPTFTGDVSVGTGATTAFFDVSTGNVGIGSATPINTLDVIGDVKFAGKIYNSANSEGSLSQVLTSGGPGGDWTWQNVTSIGAIGSVNINDTQSSDNYNLTASIVGSSSTETLYKNTNIVLSGLGSLGIGTDSPTTKLDVNGDIKALDVNVDVVTATQFIGDGSGLTNLSGVVGSGITVSNDGSTQGTVGQLDFTGDLSISVGGGVGTITVAPDSSGVLSGFSTTISDNAIQTILYDTSKDGDGGLWRKRTQTTSWYNETLNTATRGSRREFPLVALIVSKDGVLTIYDADDPNLPMWMVFTDNNDTVNYSSGTMLSSRTNSGGGRIAIANGRLVIGGKLSFHDGITIIDFIGDSARKHTTAGTYYSTLNISQRETTGGYPTSADTNVGGLQGNLVNDVAAISMPSHSTDATTGLAELPYIAVASSNGWTVISPYSKYSAEISSTFGNTSYKTGNNPNICNRIEFLDAKGRHFTNNANYYFRQYEPIEGRQDVLISVTSNDSGYVHLGPTNYPNLYLEYDSTTENNPRILDSLTNSSPMLAYDPLTITYGTPSGITIIKNEGFQNFTEVSTAYITTDFNTGWQSRKTRGTFLCSTDTSNLEDSGNLVTNGDFSNGTTDWTAGSNATLSVGISSLKVEYNGTNYPFAYQAITTEVGKPYTLSVGIVSVSNASNFSSLYFVDNPASISFGTGLIGIGTIYLTGIANSTTTYVKLRANAFSSGQFSEFDNVVVELADHDRSHDAHVSIAGTITRTPVATGAELVAYSGFSTSNGMYIPDYDAITSHNDVNNGMLSLWAYGGGADQCLFVREQGTPLGVGTDAAFMIYQASSGYYEIHTRSNGTSTWTVTSTDAKWGNYWSHICYVHGQSNVNRVYINGKMYKRFSIGNEGDPFLTNTPNPDAEIHIGRRNPDINTTEYFTGSLSLVKLSDVRQATNEYGEDTFSSTIRKIYEDEKEFFRENAKCTLYGSSNQATALAYDKVTDKLYVGTSSGRSDFRGLVRINNTTTAITNSISVIDDYIVEE